METLDKRQKWSQEQTISGKASVVSVNGTAGGGGGGGVELLSRGFKGQSLLRKVLVSKEHIDRHKIDLNVFEKRTVQDYIHIKN